MMIRPIGGVDGEIFDDTMAELGPLLEEQVTLKRWSSVSGADPAAGTAGTNVYATALVQALIEALTAQELAFSNGFYITGDLRAQFRIQIYGAEGGANGAQSGDLQTAGRVSDLIIFRGREYKIVGHPERIHYGGQYYWSAVLRQNKA